MQNGQLIGSQGAIVKSVQTGTIALANGILTNTATITSVVVANSILCFGGQIYGLDADVANPRFTGYLSLTNATTVTATRADSNQALTLTYTVVEFHPSVLKSVQTGTIALTGAASNTAAITAVDVTKSLCLLLGFSSSDVNGYGSRFQCQVTLTSGTVVTASRVTGTGNCTVSYMVVEFN